MKNKSTTEFSSQLTFKLFLAIIILSFASGSLLAQAKRDTTTRTFPNPDMVALQSALLPGLGQLTNGQWYKVPVFYAGFATLGYLAYREDSSYVSFRNAFRERTDSNPLTVDHKFSPLFPDEAILANREIHKRNRDLMFIITFGVYAINIIDAYVFAQLKDFDISDDISISIHPVKTMIVGNKPSIGTGITLNLN